MRAGAVLNDVNYYALALAVMSQKYLTVEKALDIICGQPSVGVTSEDIEDMFNLRPLPYWQIGEMYGVGKTVVHRCVKRYERRRHETRF